MHKLAKAGIMREVKDYAYITLGLISYSLGWAAFLLPYQITTGGTTGISAIIYYSTGFPIQWSYFIINAVLMTFAIRILGPRFSIKTTYAIFMLTFLLLSLLSVYSVPHQTPLPSHRSMLDFLHTDSVTYSTPNPSWTQSF